MYYIIYLVKYYIYIYIYILICLLSSKLYNKIQTMKIKENFSKIKSLPSSLSFKPLCFKKFLIISKIWNLV